MACRAIEHGGHPLWLSSSPCPQSRACPRRRARWRRAFAAMSRRHSVNPARGFWSGSRGWRAPDFSDRRPACRDRVFGASKRRVNVSTQRGPLAAKVDGQAGRVTDVPRGTRRWRTKGHGPRLFHVEQACVARGRQHNRVADVAEVWTRFPKAPSSVVVGGPQRLGRLAAFRRPGFAV